MRHFFNKSNWLCLAITVFFVTGAPYLAMAQALGLDQPIEGRIKSDEIDVYSLKVRSGQFIRIESESKDIDLQLALTDEKGETIVEWDGDPRYVWRNSFAAVSATSGIYRLLIKGVGPEGYEGSYSVTIAEIRKAQPSDQKRIEAERAMIKAVKQIKNNGKDKAEALETAARLWRALGDEYWVAVCDWNKAWLNFGSDNEKALGLFDRTLPVFQKFNDRTAESAVLNGKGIIYRQTKQYAEAESNLSKALAIRIETGRLRSEYNSRNLLVDVYYATRQRSKVLENLNINLDISRRLKRRPYERDAFELLGLFYGKETNYSEGIRYLNEALKIDTELKDISGQISDLTNLATFYEALRDYENEEKQLNTALELTRQTKNSKSEGMILKSLGEFYMRKKYDANKAVPILLEALNKVEFGVDIQIEGDVLTYLMLGYQALGNNAKVIEYSERKFKISESLNDPVGQILSQNGMAVGYGNAGQVNKAIELYERSLEIARKNKLRSLEFSCLNLISIRYTDFQEFEKAISKGEEALLLARELKDTGSVLNALASVGLAYLYSNRFDKAQERFEEAAALSSDPEYRSTQSTYLRHLGSLFAIQSQFEKAREYYERSLRAAETTGSKDEIIFSKSCLGDLFRDQRQFEYAIKFYEQAYNTAKEINSRRWQNSLLRSLGAAYAYLNQLDKARGYYEQALGIARESKDRTGEAIVQSYLGNLYSRQTQYEKALECFKEVEKIAIETKHKWLLISGSSGIGTINTDLSQNEKALGGFDQSLALAKESFIRVGEGDIYNKIGNVYVNLKNYTRARENYEKALAVALETKIRTSQISPQINLGVVYRLTNQPDKAKEWFDKGLSLARELKDPGSEGYALAGLGDLALTGKEFTLARDLYIQALGLAREVQSLKLEAAVLQELMGLFKESKNFQLALIYGKMTVNVYQRIRGNIKKLDKDSQQSYLKDKESAYRTLADLLISQGRIPEAQNVLDLLKEEEYVQLARTGEIEENIPYGKIESEIATKIDNLTALRHEQSELNKLRKEQGDQFPADKRKRIEQLDTDTRSVETALDDTLKSLAASENSVRDRVAVVQNDRNLQSAIQNLGKDMKTGIVALYTVIGAEEDKDAAGKTLADKTHSKFGWVIMVTAKDRKAYPIDVKDLEKNVFELRTALSSDQYDPKPLAEKIYTAIFRQTSEKQKVTLEADLEALLGKYPDKTIMWSLDGVLRYVPMAALHDGKGYLVEKYRNVVFTKESLLWLMNSPKKEAQMLGLGVSSGNKELKLSALPGVDKELADIVRQSGEKTGILSGSRKVNGGFKKQEILNLKDDDNGFQQVHVASHFSFNPADQNESYLLIGDGKLTFGEMKGENNLFGTVDLLTLSACDTAMSANGKESEGFAYLAQSLGAKSVIASLWKVSDAGTPELMIRFYKLRAENPQMSKGEAFRRAQLDLLKSDTTKDVADGGIIGSAPSGSGFFRVGGGRSNDLPRFQPNPDAPYAHPHYWASFVLIGNWR